MSRLDSITIPLVDLDNLIQLIADKKPAGGIIRVIDSGADYWTVRDTSDFLIGTIQKSTCNEGN